MVDRTTHYPVHSRQINTTLLKMGQDRHARAIQRARRPQPYLPNPPLPLPRGRHVVYLCLGAPLARLELRATFEGLLPAAAR